MFVRFSWVRLLVRHTHTLVCPCEDRKCNRYRDVARVRNTCAYFRQRNSRRRAPGPCTRWFRHSHASSSKTYAASRVRCQSQQLSPAHLSPTECSAISSLCTRVTKEHVERRSNGNFSQSLDRSLSLYVRSHAYISAGVDEHARTYV